jgi:hypothetical protein
MALRSNNVRSDVLTVVNAAIYSLLQCEAISLVRLYLLTGSLTAMYPALLSIYHFLCDFNPYPANVEYTVSS